MRSLNSHFGIPERELSLRVGARALDLYSGWDMRSRGLKAAFLLLSIRNIGRLPAIRDAGTSRSLSSTTVLTWLVRAPMARSISSVDAMSLGMLLRWAAPSYVLQLKSPKRMTASPRQRGLLGRAGATVLETGDRPRL
ncbi:hypothetical protein EVAR_86445_1 [Eumeta japonica]|uniref:Uncharacterized protein n=1 Tax=Eumeta variegata TaxID=151549 RepID=A0A4C1ZVB8_EUMVA|nr:hypothetical protein EVAR_86445_1 [Eumeta japonica]